MWRKRNNKRSSSKVYPESRLRDDRFRLSKTTTVRETHVGRRYTQITRNPVHFEPYHIPNIYYRTFELDNSHILITPKVDGHPCALEFMFDHNYVVLLVEKVGDTFYTIDVIESSNVNVRKMSFENRLRYLSRLADVETIYELDNSTYTDMCEYLIRLTKSRCPINVLDKIKLVIKPVFKYGINRPDPLDFGKFCTDLLIPYDVMNLENAKISYPNDGWILYPNFSDTPIKFKPYSHLSLDVRYNGEEWDLILDSESDSWVVPNVVIGNSDISPIKNNVYRCYPRNVENIQTICDETIWEVRELRDDKILPNRYMHYVGIMSRCSVENAEKTVDGRDVMRRYVLDHESYYYDRTLERPIRTTYQYLQSDRVRNMMEWILGSIEDEVRDPMIRVIDIGAGTCNMYSKISNNTNKFIEYYGLDTDPISLSQRCDQKAFNSNRILRVWGTMNGETGVEEYYSDLLNKTDAFTIVTLVNSIHYSDNLIDLFKSIMNKVQKGYIVIFSMFSNLIDTEFSNEDGENEVEIKRLGNKTYRFTYPWKNDSFTEKIYSTTDVENAIEDVDGLKIDEETELINEVIRPDQIKLIRKEFGFLKAHRAYLIRIRN